MIATICVRRPNMGSQPPPNMGSHPPPNDSPFGYNFNFSDQGLSSPPQPHGNPILNTTDHDALGHFFDHVQSPRNDFPFGDFSEDFIKNIAPHFLAHSSFFGPQPRPDGSALGALGGQPPADFQDSFTFLSDPTSQLGPFLPTRQPILQQPIQQPLQERPHVPRPRPRSQQQQQQQPQLQPHLTPTPFYQQPQSFPAILQDAHTDAAASLTTLQFGHTSPYSPALANLNRVYQTPNAQPLGGYQNSLSQPRPIQNDGHAMRPVGSNESTHMFPGVLFGNQTPMAQSAAQPRAQLQDVKWGSDTRFGRNQTFVPAQHESSEALEQRRMDTMRALRLSDSDPNTRASSPIGNQEAAVHTGPESPNGNMAVEETPMTPPKRRRKSKAKVDGENGVSEAQSLSKAMGKKRKSATQLDGSPSSSSVKQEAIGKRRKSALGQAKPPRENLTEEQKRENHIRSEKKRRHAIKEGFDDLMFIVPNIQNGSYSKSIMLNLAGEWLESLIKGNQALDREENNAP
ncbi:hypothetical protein F5Y09DRAFT_60683 [Xylaria sp. FL1042]|nr:hypothetical protein F5Y09DRAFT_60683 [Xylaria sp. FL1042]